MRLMLASASPRRRELLAAAGFEFDAAIANIDETRRVGEAPAAYVERVARAKAEAISVRCPGRPVLGADTVVVIGNEVFGKPVDAEDARQMLRQLSGRAHEVLTALALVWQEHTYTEIDRTTVWMSELSEGEIGWYALSGEPLDKAGAYAIQGLASRFVSRIEGTYTNVVGLPVPTLVRLLKQAGVPAQEPR